MKTENEKAAHLAREIFNLVERDQGFGHISDGLDAACCRGEVFAVVRGALCHTRRAARLMEKWLKKHGQY